MNIYSIDIPDIKGMVKILDRLHFSHDDANGVVAFEDGVCMIQYDGKWYENDWDEFYEDGLPDRLILGMYPIYEMETDLPASTSLVCDDCAIVTFEEGKSYMVVFEEADYWCDSYIGITDTKKDEIIKVGLEGISNNSTKFSFEQENIYED